ncbi:hypothetical protein BDY21DRAFT_117021 [Lineolata rhizophorae]|uniref:Uncharacterized protein n=1 Tax=Lineolata rhizophorae TaxID=578093 RepID=A0A6A6NPJ1_9PEZI|nr:hypothetical protein BDY21DRAFT_117021 [Lineolata rhizophorae]
MAAQPQSLGAMPQLTGNNNLVVWEQALKRRVSDMGASNIWTFIPYKLGDPIPAQSREGGALPDYEGIVYHEMEPQVQRIIYGAIPQKVRDFIQHEKSAGLMYKGVRQFYVELKAKIGELVHMRSKDYEDEAKFTQEFTRLWEFAISYGSVVSDNQLALAYLMKIDDPGFVMNQLERNVEGRLRFTDVQKSLSQAGDDGELSLLGQY